jgi:hypothetical protein
MVGWFAAASRFPEEMVGSYVSMLAAVAEWPLKTRELRYLPAIGNRPTQILFLGSVAFLVW